MNHPRTVVQFKSPELDLQMTTDNAEVVLYEYPYEEMSGVHYNDGKKWAVIWETGFMSLAAKAGFEVIKTEEPHAEVIDMYCKQQAHMIDDEWGSFHIA